MTSGHESPPSQGVLRDRPSARLLLVDAEGRVLLFRFAHQTGPLAGQTFWATPGGAVDPGESYEQAASRELFEETGLLVEDPGPQVAQRTSRFLTPDGERVLADERYFLIRTDQRIISSDHWTDLELKVMVEHRWWSLGELRSTVEQVWPENLSELLTAVCRDE